MSNKHSLSTAVLCTALAVAGAQRTNAVELLISGNFEAPVEVGQVPGWILEEFATGSAAVVNTADNTGGADAQLFVRAFEGGGPLHPAQGNFDNDNLPVGDADGVDFLTWQRGFGKTSGALPEEGDATGGPLGAPDGIINAADFNAWRANFGRPLPILTNVRLSQKVPAAAGETYTFQGTSKMEVHYSGYVPTLEDDSPFGQINTPTTTTFRMEFLNSGGAVIGSKTLDLRADLGNGFPDADFAHSPLVEIAPTGTTDVRVVAEALNMAWNGTSGPAPGGSVGTKQSLFFDDFSLTSTSSAGADLLTNGNLNQGLPDALDFWNQVETPTDFPKSFEILRTAGFANHTPSGSLGVWLSNFLGESKNISPLEWSEDPVTGTISQKVNAVAGGTYNFSGWSFFEANYSGGVDTITGAGSASGQASPTMTEIRLEFLDVNSQLISALVIDVEAARKLAGGGVANDNQWRQHTFLNAIAPANTRFARLSASMIDGVYNGTGGQQSAFFDDFSLDGPLVSLQAVPEPSSLVSLALGALLVGLRRNRK